MSKMRFFTSFHHAKKNTTIYATFTSPCSWPGKPSLPSNGENLGALTLISIKKYAMIEILIDPNHQPPELPPRAF